MSKLYPQTLLITIPFLLAACSGKESNKQAEDAQNLFAQTLQISKTYTDSLLRAKDSTAVLSLSKRLEERLADLNFSFPPDTQLFISEGENDTLIAISDRFVFLRDSLLHRFAHPLPKDTLPKDTLLKAPLHKDPLHQKQI